MELLNCTRLLEIKDGEVLVRKNTHKNVPNPYNTWAPILPENIENPMDAFHRIKDKPVNLTLKADAVVLATGSKSADALYYDCVKQNAAPEIYNIGDSFKAGKIFEAVRSAYRKSLAV